MRYCGEELHAAVALCIRAHNLSFLPTKRATYHSAVSDLMGRIEIDTFLSWSLLWYTDALIKTPTVLFDETLRCSDYSGTSPMYVDIQTGPREKTQSGIGDELCSSLGISCE
jgi:hypothetical protein